MNFNDFWIWLCARKRSIKTLGGKRRFKIRSAGDVGTIVYSTGRTHHFSKDTASRVCGRFQTFPDDKKLRAGRYVDGKRDHNWNPCPNRYCSPWIAAAIRDFEAGLD